MIKPLQFFVPAGQKWIIGINAGDVNVGFIERKKSGWWSIEWYIRIPKSMEDALKKFRNPEDAKAHANKVFKDWLWILFELQKP